MPNCTAGNSLVYDQLLLPVIISHHTPTYFTGFIHEVFSILQGSFRLYVILEARMSRASSLTIMVRQGVVRGACICPLSPFEPGVSHDWNTMLVSFKFRCMHA